MSAKPGPIRTAFWSLGVVLIAVLAWQTRLGRRWPSVYYMTGPSMEPTISAEQYFIAWAPAGSVGRGDLVLFEYRDDDGTFHVLRRLVGLPGDTVRMEDGEVFVNGRSAAWPFQILQPRASRSTLAIEPDIYTWGPWIVPDDSVILLSDTRDMIGWPDSRFLGFIAGDDIVARATRTVRGRRLR